MIQSREEVCRVLAVAASARRPAGINQGVEAQVTREAARMMEKKGKAAHQVVVEVTL